MRKYLSKEQKEKIILLYEDDKSAYEIAKIINSHYSSVYYHLYKNNIKIRSYEEAGRKYTLNENYFENIDSEDKAYFLGLIAADGCVTDNNKLLIGLQEEDGYILQKLADYANYNGILYNLDGRNLKCKKQVRLQIRSAKMIADLEKLSITSRKSLTLTFPDFLPNNLIQHFIRGYFDGDGCVKFNKGVMRIQFVGTYEFLKSIQNYFIKNCAVSELKMYQAKKDKNTYELTYGGDTQCIKIYDYLYNNSTIFFHRKKKKIIEHISNKLKLYSTFILTEEINKRIII